MNACTQQLMCEWPCGIYYRSQSRVLSEHLLNYHLGRSFVWSLVRTWAELRVLSHCPVPPPGSEGLADPRETHRCQAWSSGWAGSPPGTSACSRYRQPAFRSAPTELKKFKNEKFKWKKFTCLSWKHLQWLLRKTNWYWIVYGLVVLTVTRLIETNSSKWLFSNFDIVRCCCCCWTKWVRELRNAS